MTTPRTYRRRDTVEAVQWDGSEEGAAVIVGWLEERDVPAWYYRATENRPEPSMRIKRGRRRERVMPGGWITCYHRSGMPSAWDPAVFAATWEEV